MYNNYSPYGYQSPYANQAYYQRNYPTAGAQMQQPQPQPQPQAQFETPFQDIKFVTDKQAEAYIVYPNTRVLLIDNEKGVAHIKTADGMGQCVTQYFKFTPISADGSPLQTEVKPPEIDLSEYIKRADADEMRNAFGEQIKALEQKIEGLYRQLMGGKQNVAPRTNQQ